MMGPLAAEMFSLTLEHAILVCAAVLAAAGIGIPTALFATRHPYVRRAALAASGIFQTVPSLALFGFLVPLPLIGGIGKRTALIALVLYALLPVIRNTVVGIASVDSAVRDSAVAMGMTDLQVLFQVEVPLAARTILAGVRIATITTIGTATIAAAIGGGGLGVLIFRGISLVDSTQILAGAVPAALLAVAADGVLAWLESRLSA
jgi:osmoprotectant transport system permease protein